MKLRVVRMGATFISLCWASLANGEPSAEPVEANAASKTATAGASQPQLPLFRGGSLGVPTPSGATSVQASGVGTLSQERSVGSATADVDFFTKVGGISLDETFTAEVVGESFKLDVPRVMVGAEGALPTITTTEVSSAGLRITYRPAARSYKVFGFDPITDATPRADGAISATARELFDGSMGWAFSVGARALHVTLPGDDANLVAGTAGELIVQRTTTRRSSSTSCADTSAQQADAAKKTEDAAKALKILAEAPDRSEWVASMALDGERVDEATLAAAATQVAAQAAAAKTSAVALRDACKLDDRRSTLFISLSATYLNSQRLPMDGTMALVLPQLTETRATLGWERQSGREQRGLLLPRVGAYAALAHANWHNDFATTAEQRELDNISDWQAEAAIYASGHFSGGFSGLISVGLLLPYGNDRELQGFINLVPSIGAEIGGGS